MKVLLATTMALGVVFTLGAIEPASATVTGAALSGSQQGHIILAHGGHHGGGGWHRGGGWHGGHGYHHGYRGYGGYDGYYGGGGGYYGGYGPGYYSQPPACIGPLCIF